LPVITVPEQATLVSLFPYSQTNNGTGYVRMTENVVGKMDPDYGRVVSTKCVPCHKDNIMIGQAGGSTIFSYSGSALQKSQSIITQCGWRSGTACSVCAAEAWPVRKAGRVET